MVLSQIGDIARGDNFIFPSHKRPAKREGGLTLHALSFHLLTFKLKHILSFMSSFLSCTLTLHVNTCIQSFKGKGIQEVEGRDVRRPEIPLFICVAFDNKRKPSRMTFTLHIIKLEFIYMHNYKIKPLLLI